MKEFVCMLKEKWKSSEMYTGSIFIAMREDGSYFVSEGDALDVVYTMYRLICHPDYKTYKEQLAFLDEVAPAAVAVLTEEVVEPAASALLVEVCFACLDLGIIDLICHD